MALGVFFEPEPPMIREPSRETSHEAAATLVEVLRHRAESRGGDLAYTFLTDGEATEDNITYAELDRRARGLAATLTRMGVGGGERALLLYPPGLDYIAAFFGCLYAGAVAVPAYPPRSRRPSARLEAIQESAGAKAVLSTEAVLAGLDKQMPRHPGVVWWAAEGSELEKAAEEWRDPGVSGEALAFLQYTSGSTVAPKGVMLRHANLLANLEQIRLSFAQTAAERTVIWLPPYHDMGLIGGILTPLYTGNPAVLLSPVSFLQRPLRWLQAISRYGGTTSGGPNFAYDLCVEKISAEERERLDLSRWTLAFNGAEPVRAETLERFAAAFAACGFRKAAFLPCYGLAEGTLLAAAGRRGSGAAIGVFSAGELERHRGVAGEGLGVRSLVGSGTAPGGARLLVVDPETCVPCAPGAVGEIWIAGPAVAAGYWGLPEATVATFGAHTASGDGPYLRTGDLGFVDGSGELFVTGRSKDLIILRGRNHYPQDIELTVERSHPALRPGCGAAFAVDSGGDERLVVVQEVRREHREDDPAELVAAIRRAVAEEHEAQVHAVVLLRPATLPKTTSGKIQRGATRARYLDGTLDALGAWQAPVAAATESTAPSTADSAPDALDDLADLSTSEGVRRWLAVQVAARAAMTAEEIAVDQPLGHYPLDSLAVMELMHAVESRFGVILSMESFFAGASVGELADTILERATAPAAPERGNAVDAVGDHPLSRGQQSLWFLHALDVESAAYNVTSAVRVRGELDAGALQASIAALVARHAVLRTTFPTSRGEPVQRVHPPGEAAFIPALAETDAQGWSDHRLIDYLAAEGRRPFDLERGPLLRVVLLTRSALEHVLLLSMHHIITDFWSLGLLLDDLAVLYPALRHGRAVALPPPGLSYVDSVRWQEEMLAGARGERLWGYWWDRLAGELPVLDLHTDRPRPRVQTYEGAAVQTHLSPYLSARVKALGREREATPFITLLAAFETLLHRYTRQEDLLVGSVTAARTRAGFARTLGYFVNPLVLRADFRSDSRGDDSEDPDFGALLARTRADALGAFEHQDFPFPLLVERLQPQRDPARSPLFQVMFVLQKAQLADGQELTACALGEPGAYANVGGLRLEIVPLEQRIAQFDLTLTVGEVGEAFVASFDYNVQLFDAATVARWARHFERLLEGIADHPAAPVSALALMTAEEERQLTAVWNDTGIEFRHETTLPELLAEQAARTPEATAVLFGGERLSYSELDRRSNQLARRLRALGVGPESRVAVCLERSPALMVGLIGVLKAGGAYLPVDPETPRGRVAALLASAGAGLAVTEERLRPIVSDSASAVLTLDGDETEIASESDAPLVQIAKTAVATNLACVIYTSGSTGEPKGVLLTHRNLVNLVASFLASYRPEPADRILPLTAIGFASFVGEIFPLLCAGGTLVLPDRAELLDVSALVGLISRHGVSIVSTVPSMMASLNALRDRLPRLRLILVGGEALAAGDVDKLFGSVRIVNGYGLTETSVCSTCHTLAAADLIPGAIPPIGRPLMNHRVYLLDRHLRPLPVGCPGEIYVAGDGLARAYLGDPAATAGRFVPDPWDTGARMYRTGDLGLIRSDGELVYLGRIDQQVKLRGYRIELAEVESVLALHPRIKESFVTVRSMRSEGGEPQLVGYLVPDEMSTAPTVGELLVYLREKLPDYMVPGALVTLAALPLTLNGKIDLALLPAPDRARPSLASAYSAPRSELERTITALWQEELKVETVGVDDNFFDLGGHSLRMAKVHARLKEALGREISLIELFQYPTVSSLARHLSGSGASAGEETAAPVSRRARRAGNPDIAPDIAIIGMSGRFPGAKGVDELWRNLVAGREGITFFTAEELLAAGVSPATVANPNYVRAKGILGDVDQFDASFFGLNPRETELMDPQHRVFLECAWEALENAGWDPDRFAGLVGVYAGLSMNTYMIMNLLSHMELVASVDTLQASLGNDKDPMTSRVSYKLNLKGPSVTIQSASSTSLVAVHQACQSLLQHDCDMALAGGVSIHLPEVSGYLYQEGGTTARDGHCRAFDASATGFVSGHGAGVVVLKRLDDALADGDTVYAVIKGSACNNDGSLKVSFMAPSVEGQVEVYRQAYENAGVDPRTVSYIECHGTGTALGDPIEIAALSRVFSAAEDGRRNYCAIGSLKTNIGHLDTAAGVCGLIKTALSLYHGAIPASLHFEAPNPRIDFAGSPFFVNTELRPWPAGPRRAGVTSLGMGGTNAHVVLEAAPPSVPTSGSRPHQLLLFSAKSANALERSTARLADHLRQSPDLDLPDVAFTLTQGRKAFQHRRALLASDVADATVALETLDPERLLTTAPEPGDRPVAFLFPGQGAQYPGMGRGLYEAEPTFRADVDLCCRLLQPQLGLDGLDLRQVLFEDGDSAAERLQSTQLAQSALFVISWATARLWMSWGVRPEAMLGHSIGEYVAACLAGVFSLEDALAVVAARGRLMSQMPPGAMLGVPLPEAEVLPLLGEELSLAAVNRPAVSVVSGPVEAVEELAARLAEQGLTCRRLHTSHAFHSRMMEPVLQQLIEQIKRVRLEPPRLPFLSNVTGTWIRAEEATDPAYWARQLRQAVRFADGVAHLLAEPHRILLEVGPGNTLSTLARQHPAAAPSHAMIASLRHPKQSDPDPVFLSNALARFWLAAGTVDWAGYWGGERRRRLALPSYPFERQRYWIDPLPKTAAARPAGRRDDPAEWFYVPVWKQSRRPAAQAAMTETAETWLLFLDRCGLGEALAERLEASGRSVVRVAESMDGGAFSRGPAGFTVAAGRRADYDALFDALGRTPAHILHLWNVTSGPADGDVEAALDRGYYSLVFLAQALGRQSVTDPTAITVVSNGLCEVTGDEPLDPLKATLVGPVTVIPREYLNLSCRSVDVALGGDLERTAGQILDEIGRAPELPTVAFRGHLRWVREYEQTPLERAESRLRPGGVCLITGGLGGLGLELAEFLAHESQARLVLVGRSAFPERARWADWLAEHHEGDATRGKIERLLAIEELGGEVLALSADVTDPAAMREVLAQAERRFGAVHGVIHAAGVPGGGLLQGKSREAAERILAPKVRGALVLSDLFAGSELDLFVLTSSITVLLPQVGQADYVAANAFLDAFATVRSQSGQAGQGTTSIGWDAWRETGMALTTEVPEEWKARRRESLAQGLSSSEGVEAFARITASGLPQVVTSTLDLAGRLAENDRLVSLAALDEAAGSAGPAAAVTTSAHPRPALATAYVQPQTDLERGIAAAWQEILGVEPIGLHDNFFELGGNSLAGLRLVQRLREQSRAGLSEVSLYEAPTVGALARLIAKQTAAQSGPEEEEAMAGSASIAGSPAEHESRQRGERRKARLQGRRGTV